MLLRVSVVLVCISAQLSLGAYPCDYSGQVYTPCPAPWTDVGPGSYPWFASSDPHLSKIAANHLSDDEQGYGAGAIQVIGRADDGKTWYVGSVNGGIWKTSDITVARPHYVNVLDGQHVRCYSISALAIDGKALWAACGGSTSSEMGRTWNVLNTGDWAGLIVSRDDGKTWDSVRSFPMNYYVTGIIVRGATVLVSARSNFYNRDDGGIWRGNTGGSSWVRVFTKPVFYLAHSGSEVYAAVAMEKASAYVSTDDGSIWTEWSNGIEWSGGRLPFFPTLAVGSTGTVFIGALTVSPGNADDTFSDVFYREKGATTWKKVANGEKLDDDAMPKDRMALLADPDQTDILYVAGNGGALAYRVRYSTGQWEEMWGDEALKTAPHPDCRNFAWDHATSSLLLVTDGGVYRRTQPRAAGGKWSGQTGDIGEMEIYMASWDMRLNRWIGGAQDNSVLLTKPDARADSLAYGVVGGDGTLTAVDNRHNPSRLYGCIQFLGGLGFIEGSSMKMVQVPVNKWFPDVKTFPFFAHPFTLNTQNPELLIFWAAASATYKPAFWEATIPAGATNSSAIKFPRMLAESNGGAYYTVVAGGFSNNESDISVLVAMNDTHLYHRNRFGLRIKRLPQTFAQPVIFTEVKNNNWVLGPLSHFKTVSLAVNPADSNVVAISGWASIQTNTGQEAVWLSFNAGATWTDITGNLERASATIAKIRPAGVLIFPFPTLGAMAILVGTVNGVYVTWTDQDRVGLWSRLGYCENLPQTLVPTLTYEHYSDTLVAASLGRGVYILRSVTHELIRSREQQSSNNCNVPGWEAKYNWEELKQTQFYPPQW